MNKKGVYILLSLLVFSLCITFIDIFIRPDYFIKILFKIIFFLVLPLIFFVINKGEFKSFKELFRIKKDGFLKSLGLGLFIYSVILICYFLTRNIIDYSNVTNSLGYKMNITKDNFIYVFVYVAFLNSFLEEFFFRGFGFITLKKHSNRKLSYILNSLMFAVYHIGMVVGMFNIYVIFIILVGLFCGGLIFSRLNDTYNNIYPSWFAHMFANFAINTIGLILFNII